MLNARQWCIGLILVMSAVAADAASGRIIKVLPHYLDLEGRHTLSPSHFERDAYQELLRKNPERRSARRFDIQWKGKARRGESLRLKVEIRGSKAYTFEPFVLEKDVAPRRWFSKWSAVALEGEPYREMGEITAWKVTLWEGDNLLHQQQSFLW